MINSLSLFLRKKLKQLQSSPKYIRRIRHFVYQELDKKTGEVKKSDATYFIYGGHKNKNVYICPRIWCVRCDLPISSKSLIRLVSI